MAHVAAQFPGYKRIHWILDNLNTHWSLNVCELLARLNGLPFHKKALRTGAQRRTFLTDPEHKHVFHFTPKHGSWLNLIEGFFSKFARSVLRHIRVTSKHELKQRIMAGIDDVNRHPVIHTWSYKLAEAA